MGKEIDGISQIKNTHSNKEFSARSLDFQKCIELAYSMDDKKDLPFKNFLLAGLLWGLRYSDISTLTYEDIIILEDEDKIITQKKRNKKLKLFPHPKMIAHFKYVYENTFNIKKETPILAKFGTQKAYGYDTIDNRLKKMSVIHELTPDGSNYRVSTHSLRKTFARHFYDVSGQRETSLLALSTYFNHDSLNTTRIYIGLIDEEIYNVLNSFEK